MVRLVQSKLTVLLKEIDDQYRGLDEYVSQRRTDVPLSRADSRLSKTVRWLLQIQRESGAWGNEEVAATALTILALESLRAQGLLDDPHDEVGQAFGRAAQFLKDAYNANQWERAVWDTAVAARALRYAAPNSELLPSLRDWLMLPSTSRTFGPHHYAQRIITLAEWGVHRDNLNEIADKMCAQMRGVTNYSEYVLAQTLESLLLLRPEDPLVAKCTQRLFNYLAGVSVDSANFVNICVALHALHDVNNVSNTRNTRVAVASLFGDTSFRDNGSWYRNEIATAWGILTLTRYSTEVRMEAPFHEFQSRISDSSTEVASIVTKYNRMQRKAASIIALGSAGVGALACLFAALTFSSHPTNASQNWLLGSLLTLGVTTVLTALKFFGAGESRGGAVNRDATNS